MLTTVENVGKLKGGSALLYDPDRFSGRTWLNAEKHFMLYNMYSKKKLKEHAKLDGNRQKMSHQIWQLVKPHAVKPTEKDLSNHYVDSPVKEDKPVVKKSKPGLSTVRFITTFPKKVFEDENMTLNDAKFGKSEALKPYTQTLNPKP